MLADVISSKLKILKSDQYNLRSINKTLVLSKPKTNSMKMILRCTAPKDWKYSKHYKPFD